MQYLYNCSMYGINEAACLSLCLTEVFQGNRLMIVEIGNTSQMSFLTPSDNAHLDCLSGGANYDRL